MKVSQCDMSDPDAVSSQPQAPKQRVSPVRKMVKSGRWNAKEVGRLKILVKLAKPETEQDWEMVGKSLGGRSAKDCLEKSVKEGLLTSGVRTADDDFAREFFQHAMTSETMSDVTMLPADDSMLEALKSPTRVVRNSRRRPFIPQILNVTLCDDDDDGDDEEERDRTQRRRKPRADHKR